GNARLVVPTRSRAPRHPNTLLVPPPPAADALTAGESLLFKRLRSARPPSAVCILNYGGGGKFPLLSRVGSGTASAFKADMLDLVFLAASVTFFAISVAYVEGCRRLW